MTVTVPPVRAAVLRPVMAAPATLPVEVKPRVRVLASEPAAAEVRVTSPVRSARMSAGAATVTLAVPEVAATARSSW